MTRANIALRPDCSRVCFRPFSLGDDTRHLKIVARVMGLSDAEAAEEWQRVSASFADRHLRLREYFLERFEQMARHLASDRRLSEERRLLLGSYFTHEYALEAAALFNPSIVPHPDQSGLQEGELRFALSLRATGEGHVSSITFRSGVVDRHGSLRLDPPTPYVTAGEAGPQPRYERELLRRKLQEEGSCTPSAQRILSELPDAFGLARLEEVAHRLLSGDRHLSAAARESAERLLHLARANYAVRFRADQPLSERVLFPYSPSERRGIEDARFVRFRDEQGGTRYYATYTAFDGRSALPQILDTEDFRTFAISALNGPQARGKGMALFPRKIKGRYAMVSRQDGENLYLMYSDMLHFWREKHLLMRPTHEWEFVQIGNCGSPLETDRGWLLLTHGVGPMRQYAIGAALLDYEDPCRVVARSRYPLLAPTEEEREGYVPNVVYTCGGLAHQGKLLMPYAMSDQCTCFATFELDEVLDSLESA